MVLSDYVRFVLALVFVLALIGTFTWLARRYGVGGRISIKGDKGRRLGIVEVQAIDSKRRLVLVRRDHTEHLVLLGGGNDMLIEQDIAASPTIADPTAADPAPRVSETPS